MSCEVTVQPKVNMLPRPVDCAPAKTMPCTVMPKDMTRGKVSGGEMKVNPEVLSRCQSCCHLQ